MKTLSEIIAQAENYRAASREADDAARAADDKHRETVLELYARDADAITPEEERNADAAGEAATAARERAELARIEAAAAVQLARRYVHAATVTAYAETIPAFVGKPAGEKTRAKLCEAIERKLIEAGAPAGTHCYIGHDYKGTPDGMNAYIGNFPGWVNIDAEWDAEKRRRAIVDETNRFNGAALQDAGKIDDAGHIITSDGEAYTVETFARHFIAAEKEAKRLEAEFTAKIKALRDGASFEGMRPEYYTTNEQRREIDA